VIGELFYTLFIWPIRFILEFFFVLSIRIFDAPGSSVIFLSIVVNTLTLPIYIIADRWQKEERELQKRMKKKLTDIKAVFKGDERQMIINTYYRQMGYSPVFVVKASVGLLLQIPFFIAAYQFLSHTSLLSEESFFFLKNLSESDALFHGINIMPIIMTAVNLVSALIYAKDLGKREIIQLLAMALVFLALLYNSPSGLVLYWTMNNVYSLVKNAAQRGLKNPGMALQAAFSIFAILFLFLIWNGKASVDRYRPLFTGICLALIAAPFIWKALVKLLNTPPGISGKSTADAGSMSGLYLSAMALLFLLLGFLSPAQVLSTSLSDFAQPWTFMGRSFLQGIAFLLLIPLFIRALAPKTIRRVLAASYAVLTISCMVCYFVLAKSYGRMDRNFKLDDTERLLHAFPLWVNIAVPLAAVAITAFLIYIKKERILSGLFGAASFAVVIMGVINLVSLGTQYRDLEKLQINDGPSGEIVFPLSQTGTNTFIVFFDRAQGTAMQTVLEEWPALAEQLDGFTFYPNTLSFGSCTVTGVPAMLGGYAYTPLAINERTDELLVDKVNEAITLLPRLFGEAGYRVTITDPVIANMQSVPDISIFKDMKNVTARNLSGTLSNRYRDEFPIEDEQTIDSFDFDILFRYGLFRAAFPALRFGIHYKGQWWRESAYNSYGRAVGEFSSLYYWPQLCSVADGTPVSKGTLNIFMNSITHESGAYNSNFVPQNSIVVFSETELEKYGSEDNAEYIYTFMAAMTQFTKWLDYLKANNVYDNTRIIVISDHGGSYHNPFLDFAEMESHNPLLLVKEAGARGLLVVSGDLMTHSDTPALAAVTLTEQNAGNTPAQVTVLQREAAQAKTRPLWAVSETSSQPLRHGPYGFSLEGKRALRGGEMFRSEAWGAWEREE
jgi:YidC/Oxa1 family membrane protein insertase